MQALLVGEEQGELVAGSEVLLAADPHRADTQFLAMPQLGRSRTDAPVSGKDNEVAGSDDGPAPGDSRFGNHVPGIPGIQ